MAFTEDLGVFFDVAGGFAVTATRTPAGGGTPTAGAVIFDVNGLSLDSFEVVTDAPAFVVPASTWPNLAEGDSFAIGAGSFVARQVIPQRDGAINLAVLARA